MPELTVVTRATAKPGCEAELDRELQMVAALTHRELGCLRYILHRSVENPLSFMVIERWASKEALDHHFAMPYVQALLKKAAELLAEPPEIKVFEMFHAGLSNKGHF